MFCPQCGQQQASGNIRFCSRCGLPIGGLAEWLAGGGVLAAREDVEPSALASQRRKRISQGAKLMFLSGVLLPVCFGLAIIIDGPGPLIIPLTIFLAGLSWMLYFRLFGEETPPAAHQQSRPLAFGATTGANALPPASNPVTTGAGGKQVRTKELARPPSVTEHTTRLLDKE